MKALARSSSRNDSSHVYIVGGGTAVHAGWRDSTIGVDLYSEGDNEVFRDVHGIKERLGLTVEFARPEHFVPALAGSEDRHVFVGTVGNVTFHHYDPYAQLFSKVVRGFRRDMDDAASFVESGMVDADRFRSLVLEVPDEAFAEYPALSRDAVLEAVDAFLSGVGS